MHIFYNVFERAHQGELKPEKILSISQKLNEIWHLKYEKQICKIWGPPLRKIPKLEPQFCSSKCSYVAHVMCQMTKAKIKKKIGIRKYPSSVIALELVLLRHNL